jgi:hypothetical protein
MALKLWNFATSQYDTVTTITDANAPNYYPANKVLENIYAVQRDQGEQPIQALQSVLERVTWPQIG